MLNDTVGVLIETPQQWIEDFGKGNFHVLPARLRIYTRAHPEGASIVGVTIKAVLCHNGKS